MAEDSYLWTTDGTGDGGTVGYADTDVTQIFRGFTQTNSGAVSPDYLNELAVSGSASPVSVNTGQALVYGYPYYNSTSGTIAVPTPAGDTRVDRIVLRASWSAQTVRVTRIAGTEGNPSAPALTQTANTTWDIPLAQASITTGGVITLTDEREYLNIVSDDGITTTKIADSAVTTTKINDDAVTNAKVGAAAVDTTELADDAVTAAKLASYSVDPRASISGTNGIVVDPENGDARGNDAVDLQTNRASDGQVASGLYSVLTGGQNNTVSNEASVASGGKSNTVSGAASIIGGGQSNQVLADYGSTIGGRDNFINSGDYSVVAGGQSNEATGSHSSILGGNDNDSNSSATYSAIGGGRLNTTDGAYSFIPGGFYANALLSGQMAHAMGRFAAVGDAQHSRYIMRRQTTDATQSELFLDGSSARLTIGNNRTYMFVIHIVARRTDADNESAAYEIKGCIDSDASTTVALVGSITKTVIAEDTAAWDVTAEADDTNDALVIKVTGEGSKTINWVATVFTTETIG